MYLRKDNIKINKSEPIEIKNKNNFGFLLIILPKL
jgi:hypothetical protein